MLFALILHICKKNGLVEDKEGTSIFHQFQEASRLIQLLSLSIIYVSGLLKNVHLYKMLSKEHTCDIYEIRMQTITRERPIFAQINTADIKFILTLYKFIVNFNYFAIYM